MRGICGIFDLKEEKRIELDILLNMREKLVHRGPYGCNHYIDGNLGLGFSRLSIIDLERGMCPLFVFPSLDMVTVFTSGNYNYV
ncbi:MAG: hypothetical protein ACFFG0_20380 [Candidatus Thorarchaeota archaeon]